MGSNKKDQGPGPVVEDKDKEPTIVRMVTITLYDNDNINCRTDPPDPHNIGTIGLLKKVVRHLGG